MERKWIFAIILILGGTALYEYFSRSTFPSVEYKPTELPELDVGEIRHFKYWKNGETVGSYEWWIEKREDYEGVDAYFTWSTTKLTIEDGHFNITNLYVHSTELVPLAYQSNASLSEERRTIVCDFNNWDVMEEITLQGQTFDFNITLEEPTVLIDNNMLAHWDLLLKTFQPEANKRTSITIFIPQSSQTTKVELYRDKKLKTITIGETNYECQIIREANLELALYLYEGDLIRYQDKRNEILLEWIPS